MKRFKGILIVACALVLGMSACTKDDFTYQGPLQVEYSGDAKFYTFGNGFFAHTIKKVGLDSLKISLIGPQQTRSLKLDYEVVPAVYFLQSKALVQLEKPEATDVFQTYSTTAVKDVDFAFAEVGTVIPANSSFGYIKFNVLALPTTAGVAGAKDFFLVLKTTDDVKAAKNYRILRVRVQL